MGAALENDNLQFGTTVFGLRGGTHPGCVAADYHQSFFVHRTSSHEEPASIIKFGVAFHGALRIFPISCHKRSTRFMAEGRSVVISPRAFLSEAWAESSDFLTSGNTDSFIYSNVSTRTPTSASAVPIFFANRSVFTFNRRPRTSAMRVLKIASPSWVRSAPLSFSKASACFFKAAAVALFCSFTAASAADKSALPELSSNVLQMQIRGHQSTRL